MKKKTRLDSRALQALNMMGEFPPAEDFKEMWESLDQDGEGAIVISHDCFYFFFCMGNIGLMSRTIATVIRAATTATKAFIITIALIPSITLL